MPYLRISRARYPYSCSRCSTKIYRKQHYFRDEPHPYARMRGEAVTRQLCLKCVLGEEGATNFLQSYENSAQLPLDFEITKNGFLIFPPRVELVDITPQVIEALAREPIRLRELTPELFEVLLCDRLDALGFDSKRVGSNTYSKDGGVDIIAWPRASVIPLLIAVQAKHTRNLDRKISPSPIRELSGVLKQNNFNAGLVVTNTNFSPDARWAASNESILIRLRDFDDLCRWLRGDFLREKEWRDIPAQIELAPGVVIDIKAQLKA